MTQHEQGLTNGNVEHAVSVWKWHIAEPDLLAVQEVR